MVDAVGWKANWSLKVRLVEGLRNDGYVILDDNALENPGNDRGN